jgi:hypothetical protein
MPKTLTLTIPDKDAVPEIISSFSPEENFLMLKIGSDCLREGRNIVAGLTQQEIYNKIKEESKEEVRKLEMDLIVQKEMSKQMEEKIGNIYEGQVEQLKKQLESMREQIRIYESGNKENMQNEIEKVREKYELVLQEKDNQNKINREAVEKLQESIIQLTSKGKSNSAKGSEGEKEFSEYADTFKDFKSFELVDKHTQGGQGDFHMHFEEFDILVDAKNYKKKVPIDQREKIKKDLIKNEHMTFAWLVSLNTSIDKYDKSPIMYEWINTNQCIVYINNLSGFEEPHKILRIVWFTCKELFNLIKDENMDVSELTELKNKQFKLIDKIKDIRKHIRELNTNMNQTRNIVQSMDEQLREIIELESSNIVNSNFSLFDDWWEKNVEPTNDEHPSVSTDFWMRFKQDNKALVKDMELTVDKFKQYIKSKVSISNLIVKSKNANSAFDIKGFKLRSIENMLSEKLKVDENIIVELVEDVVKNKKVKKQKEENKIIKSGSRWIDKEDAELKKRYNEEMLDIIELSLVHNRTPAAILLRLNKIGILEKLEDARGYNLLDEKNKIKLGQNSVCN